MEPKFLKFNTVLNPDTGRILEYVDKRPCVVGMIVDAELKRALMVKQFRAGVQDYIYEFPAGVIEEHQTPLDALFAEVRQEVGIDKDDMSLIAYVGHYLSSVGWTTEDAHLYFVQLKPDYKHLEQQLDEEESVTYEWVNIDEIDKLYKKTAVPIKTAMLLNYYRSL